MDNELFELCKEVYDRLRWDGDFYEIYWHKLMDNDYQDVRIIKRGQITTRDGAIVCPLYTSDYLLEKLPKTSPRSKDAYLAVMKKNTPKDVRSTIVYSAGFFTGYGWSYNYKADTPLKALLKLTLALKESGEL